MLLVKNDLSEYRFYKYDEGTGKTLKLRKKHDELETVFLKKLDSLKYNDLESFEKIFDRSEFIKEFYQLYCDAEKFLMKNIKGIPDDEDKEFFSKLIIERIMFLWFLQKKGFLDDDKNYFVNRYTLITDKRKNFYKDFLKKLFFNGLCKKENERGEALKELIGDVPYLNGGLFVESEIELKYGNSIEIDDKAFYNKNMNYPITKGEKNIPILNLMECKEWTIDERSGEVDKLNPEILGYIFEKSINQKDLGAVYTPEEITTYISRNTIYPYIVDRINEEFNAKFEYKSDITKDFLEKLNRNQLKKLLEIIKNLRVLDPAVGSGHFLVDAILSLEKVYQYLYSKDIIGWSKFEIREYIIKENLFGVDILPGAIEICKLRMFLALAEAFETKEDIHPLPNIEFNFRSGNSLIGFASIKELNQKFMSVGSAVGALNRNMDFLKKYYPNLAKKSSKVIANVFNMSPMDLFDIRNQLVKQYRTPQEDKEFQIKLREVINDITKAFNDELNNRFYGKIRGIFDKNKELKKLRKKEKFDKFLDLKPFHWVMEFSEVIDKGGFDVVIGNPPYIRIHNLGYFEADFIKNNYKTPFGKFDIYIIFYERSFNLINKSGRVGIISSSSFFKAAYGKKLTNFLFENKLIDKIIDFGHNQIFKGVSTYTLLFFGSINQNKKYFDYQKIEYQGDKSKFDLSKIKIKNHISYINKQEINWEIEFSSPISKYMYSKFPLSNNYFYTRSPLFTGNDDILIKNTKEEHSKFLEEKIWRKVIRPTDINKWKIKSIEHKVFFPYSENNKFKLINEKDFREKYPFSYEYLKQFKEELLQRKDSRKTFKEMNRKWYSLMRIGNPLDYKSTKILTLSIIAHPRFCIDTSNTLYTTGGIYALIPRKKEYEENMQIILGILNSDLINYFLLEHGDRKRGGYIAISANLLKNIPIAINNNETIKKVVNAIIVAKNKQYLTHVLNYIVYELYFSEKFKEDKMPTNLAGLVESYIFDIDKIKSDDEKLKKINEFVKKIQENKKIQQEIEKIKSHPWVKIIEEEVGRNA